MAEKPRGLMRNPILHTFVNLKGNQRVCLWTEPLFGIPHNLFIPLAAVYMAALGMSPFMIGLVTTVSLVGQTLASAIAGIMTDKLGRRGATAVFDLFAWIIPSIIWATASGPWSFLIAAFSNGCWRVTETSWGLLMTEDYPPEGIIHLYAITNIAGLVAGFVSPLAYLLVREVTLVTAVRWLYAVMAVTMSVKTLLIFLYTKETSVGLRQMKENKGVSVFSRMLESRVVLRRMFRSRHIMLMVTLVACFMLIRSVNDNFLPLLLTEKLGIAGENLSLFSTVRTLVMLLFYFVLVPRLDVRRFLRPMTLSMILLIIADIIFFALSRAMMGMIIFNVLMEAAALSMMTPMLSSLRMQVLEREERARMFSFTTMLALLVTAPFGAVTGWLSQVNRSLPMLLNVGLALLSVIVCLRLDRELRDKDIL